MCADVGDEGARSGLAGCTLPMSTATFISAAVPATIVALAIVAWFSVTRPDLPAVPHSIAHVVTAIGIRRAGRDIRHAVAVQVFRIVVHIAVGWPIGLPLGGCRWLGFRVELGSLQS